MASSRVRRSRLVSPFVVAWAISCGEDSVDRSTGQAEQVAAGEQLSGHLGRIHVVLQPRPDELEPEPELQVHARFIEYRGVSEPQVRARVNLPVPAWEQLVMGQCLASEELLPEAGSLSADDQEREISMIDAGDLRVGLGNREFVAPVSLVPDILPWLSGVEYGHVDDRVPQLAVEPDGTSPLSVTIDGSPDDGFESFSVSAVVPAQLALEAAKVTDDRLTIDWRPPGHPSDFIVLRLQGFTPGEDGVNDPTGEEVTCVVADSGRADLSLAPLAGAGLAAKADLLRVSVSRFDVTQVRAGGFGLVDVWVELRAQRLLHSGM
jgi:hypothetical protein